jgi:transposase
MSKTFRPWQVDQQWLLPPSVRELVPEGHLAHFLRDTVREDLDLSEIFAAYDEERGYPPYHPTMMTALLLFSYCQGVYSSRRIAKACRERVDFMAVTAMQQPDFRTVSDFRKRHLEALGRLFHQVLRLCQRAQMVKLGHVALDGTKIKANASKHKAMSYGRMKEAEPRLAAEVNAWFERAGVADTAEDAEFGPNASGDELPTWVADRQKRRDKIREAMAALEAEAIESEGTSPNHPLRALRASVARRSEACRRTRPSATSPTRRAGCSRRRTASCRATTAKRPSTRSLKSSWLTT